VSFLVAFVPAQLDPFGQIQFDRHLRHAIHP
jgi:hypothetical protein